MLEQVTDLQERLAQCEQEKQQLELQLKAIQAKIDASAIEASESGERMTTALTLEQLGIWEWKLMRDELYLSVECRNILGIPLGQTVNFNRIFRLLHPEDAERIRHEVKQALRKKGDHEFVQRVLRSDNQHISWIKVKAKTVLDENGRVVKFLGTVIDFTEYKKKQDKLLLSERLFKSVTRNIPKSLIIIVDKNHRFVAIEGEIMEKMGYNSAIFTGKPITDGADSNRYETTKELYDRMLGGEQFTLERKSDTGEIYMVHFVPLKNEETEVEAGLIIALDITDIKDAEEKSAKLAAIIQSSDDAIISKTLQGIITSWNDAANRIFGYSAEEMIGQPILKLIPMDRQYEETDILSRMRNGEHVDHFETKRMRKDGSIIEVSLTISPVKDSQGKIIGLSKIARDITERKQEEQRKNDFVAIVSHELKTPLTSIIGYIQILLAKAKKEGIDQFSTILQKTEVQAKKMATMIQDFLDLAKMEDGKLQIVRSTFDLSLLLDEILLDAQFKSAYHQIEVSICRDTLVYADREKIGQVLINLLSNAIKYTPDGGKIAIGCEQENGKVRVFVSDEGIGISVNDQKRLFDRFYRVNDDRNKSISGFGIGLYFVSEILRYHESTIEVKSEEGKGSTFTFSLDIART